MPEFLKRKERIILTAVDIINENGYQGLSIKELAQRQKITEGAIYRHFKSKVQVVLGVLDYFSQFDKDIQQSIIIKQVTSKEKILFMMSRYGEYYQGYPAMTAILHSYETFLHEESIDSRVKVIYYDRINMIKKLVQEGVDKGEFPSDIDVMQMADTLIGILSATTLRWRMKDFSFSLNDELKATTHMVMKVFS